MRKEEANAILEANLRWTRWLARQKDQPPFRGWDKTNSGKTGDGQYELYYEEIECSFDQEMMRRQFEKEALDALKEREALDDGG